MQISFTHVGTLHDRLGANAHPIQLPIGAEDKFKAIIDLVEMKAIFYGDDTRYDVEVVKFQKNMLSKLKNTVKN